MTSDPNKEMKDIHNRMPVILSKGEEKDWLSVKDDDSISSILHPYHDDGLDLIEVTSKVNSPMNNDKRLLTPSQS